MKQTTDYDVAIIGGGLAGLAAAICLRRYGHSVILLEKESYPFHRVCGEYISMESWNFLNQLGLPLADLHLPRINQLQLTAPNGKEFCTALPLGGFGISRYLLDKMLADVAVKEGVVLLQKTKVDEVKFASDVFELSFNQQSLTTKVCCGAFGKRSNLDVKWQRPFLQQQNQRLNNYVGIKYHIKTHAKEQQIALHNFENGYCGLSRIEDDNHCLCYLTKAENLKRSGNSIRQMEETFLWQNPHLKKIFQESTVLENFPVAISQISFSPKSKVENGVLLLGDSAGMITPLCGNGMSIALHTAKIASAIVTDYLHQKISRCQMETMYEEQWHKQFARRLQTGRFIQSFFGNKRLSNFFVATFKAAPFLAQPLIKLTHGKPF